MDESTRIDVCICMLWLSVTGHWWTLARDESAGFGHLYYFQFAVNSVTSFVFITLP